MSTVCPVPSFYRPRLFVGNFDFEHRLVHGDGSLPGKLERLHAVLAKSWRLIANVGDAIWWPYQQSSESLTALNHPGLPRVTPIYDPRDLAASHELIFWAEDAGALRNCQHWDFSWHGCDPETVRRVNSRRFQTELEDEFGVAPVGLRLTTSLDALSEAIGSLDHHAGWVLKTEFGTAGRESRRGRGLLPPNVADWAAKRFARELAIVVEPRLDTIAEAGIQFQIDRSGGIKFLGVTECLVHPGGTYRASRLLADQEGPLWQDAIEIGVQAARRLTEIGYFGPLGIDAMRYRDRHGAEHLRAIQDINARYTMGRLALGLKRFPGLSKQRQGTFEPATWL